MVDSIVNSKGLSGNNDSGVTEEFIAPDEFESEDAEKFKNLVTEDGQEKLVDPASDNLQVDRVGNLERAQEVLGVTEAQPENMTVSGTGILENSIQSVSNPSIGDKILDGFQKVRDHVHKGALEVQSAMEASGENMSVRDMLRTQVAMTNLTITEDFIGKIASKGTQGFDTLLRNQ